MHSEVTFNASPVARLCPSGVAVVDAGHTGAAVHHDGCHAGARAASHHPSSAVRGGRAHADGGICSWLRAGHALLSATQQLPHRITRDGLPEHPAVHGHPEAGFPSSARRGNVHVPTALRTLPGSRGRRHHLGVSRVPDRGASQAGPERRGRR